MSSKYEQSVKHIENNIIKEVERLILEGGPIESDMESIRLVAEQIDSGPQELKDRFHQAILPIINKENLLGFAYLQPHGYAGDFEFIDKIHTNHISKKDKYRKWDIACHNLAASVALRNRKEYFNLLVDSILKNKGSVTVLNLGSGPARDVKEYFDNRPHANVHIDCVDMDPTSINYAKKVCSHHLDKVRFFNKNVLRLKVESQYDLVWSAGMFDYFNDKLFTRLVKKYFDFVKEGGQMALGNISDTNPDRLPMEVFAQWHLHHRSKQDLIDIINSSGIKYSKTEVLSEPTGVNIFTHTYK